MPHGHPDPHDRDRRFPSSRSAILRLPALPGRRPLLSAWPRRFPGRRPSARRGGCPIGRRATPKPAFRFVSPNRRHPGPPGQAPANLRPSAVLFRCHLSSLCPGLPSGCSIQPQALRPGLCSCGPSGLPESRTADAGTWIPALKGHDTPPPAPLCCSLHINPT